MLTILISILLFISTHSQTPPEVIPVRDPNNIVISFGSCLNTFDESSDIDQSIGSVIAAQPDVWMWTGDAIYLDGDSFFLGFLGGAGYDIHDEGYTVGVFNTLKSRPVYTQLMAATRIIGVWDDHDYAFDNANETFEYKQRNMGIYLDFVDEPANSPRRNQQGIYTSYYIGNETLVKVIMLDVRYNRDSESTTTSLLETDTTERFDDMLGEEQWAWLDLQLQDNTAPYTLLVSGTQYLPDDRPIVPNWFRNSKDRILDIIRNRQKSGVILISGDVHYAEMIRHPCPNRVGYTNFYEFTSSGMTHSATFADIFDGIIPDTYSTEDDRYFEKNFGVLRFSRPAGSTDVPNLIFEARSIEGEVVLSREVVYSDLIFDEARANSYTGCQPIDSDASDTNSSTSNDIVDSVQDVVGDENNGDGDGANGVIDDIQDVFGDENDNDGVNGVVNDIQDVGNAIDDIFSKKK